MASNKRVCVFKVGAKTAEHCASMHAMLRTSWLSPGDRLEIEQMKQRERTYIDTPAGEREVVRTR